MEEYIRHANLSTERATLPKPKRMTAGERIYQYLLYSQDWVPLYRLQDPDLGGTSADRRIRELRAKGVPIQLKFKEVDGRKTHTSMYRIKPAEKQMSFA